MISIQHQHFLSKRELHQFLWHQYKFKRKLSFLARVTPTFIYDAHSEEGSSQMLQHWCHDTSKRSQMRKGHFPCATVVLLPDFPPDAWHAGAAAHGDWSVGNPEIWFSKGGIRAFWWLAGCQNEHTGPDGRRHTETMWVGSESCTWCILGEEKRRGWVRKRWTEGRGREKATEKMEQRLESIGRQQKA